MTDRDPKDMTASELLRWAALHEIDSYGNDTPDARLFSAIEGRDYCHTADAEDREALRTLADKIDAEIVKAYSEKLNTCAIRWAKANGWPDFRKGEDFGAWLDRCALPRPRFKDGEPVQFGEEVELHYKSGGCDKGRFQEIKYNKGSVWMLSFTGVDHAREYRYDSERDTIKRPAPEVLGADGKPIMVGDTVYGVNNGHRYTVMGLPVPSNNPIYNSNDDRLHLIHDESGLDAIFSAQKLTHTPPETLERLRNDIAKWRADCANPGSEWDAKTAEWADRIDAIIRRTGGAE